MIAVLGTGGGYPEQVLIAPVDLVQVKENPEAISPADLRPAFVNPSTHRDLQHDLFDLFTGMHPDDPGHDLHIKKPPCQEGLVKHPFCQVPAEQLGPALGVVNPEVKDIGDERGDDPADKMAVEFPFDRRSYDCHPRSETKPKGGLFPEKALQVENLFKRSGKICIKIAEIPGSKLLKPLQHPGSHCFRLAFVIRHVAYQDPAWKLVTERNEQGLCFVAASVINEAERSFGMPSGKFRKLVHGETVGFIVKGNDDTDRIHRLTY